MYTKLSIQLNRAIYLLKTAQSVLLVGHKKPDTDTTGAAIALGLFLERFGKKVTISFYDNLPASFSFLPKADQVIPLQKIAGKFQDFDVIITLDCGRLELSGLHNFLPKDSQITLINIDHHYDSSMYGTINIVNGDASSTSEVIFDLFTRLGFLPDKDIATALLCGIFGDTDSFKNSNTTDKTLQITSTLLSCGADLNAIVKNVLQDKSVASLRLWGKALSRIKKHKELNIVSTIVTEDDIKESDASYHDLEGIANFLNSIPDAKGSLIISERENGEIKGSFRTLSNSVDVSKLAHLLGGGGHKKAAGFAIPGRLAQENGRWKII